MNIPEGYILVPVEPTEEMLVVMHERILIDVNSEKREANILNDKEWWAAVIASTPIQMKVDYHPSAWQADDTDGETGKIHVTNDHAVRDEWVRDELQVSPLFDKFYDWKGCEKSRVRSAE